MKLHQGSVPKPVQKETHNLVGVNMKATTYIIMAVISAIGGGWAVPVHAHMSNDVATLVKALDGDARFETTRAQQVETLTHVISNGMKRLDIKDLKWGDEAVLPSFFFTAVVRAKRQEGALVPSQEPMVVALEVINAVEMLGHMRSEQAVPVLMDHIDRISTWDGWNKGGVDYPCYWALIKIGKPSSQEALRRLSKGVESEQRARLLVSIIGRVEGAAQAEFVIGQQIAKSTDEAQKKNLRAAQKLLAEIKSQPRWIGGN